jgi:hypothetical protein
MRALPALLLLLACAHGPTAEQLLAWQGVPHAPASLSSEMAIADVDLLLYAMREGYGGRRHVDAVKFQGAVLALEALKESPPPGAKALCDAVGEILAKVPDNHLRASLEGKGCGSRPMLEGHVGANQHPSDTWHVETTDQVVRISITRMPSHEEPLWNGFIDKVRTALPDARAVVIDARGNGGGDDTIAYQLAALLWGGDVPAPSRQIVSQTPATFALAINDLVLRVRRLESKHEPVPEYLSRKLTEKRHGFDEARAGRLQPEIERPSQTGAPFDAAKGFDRPVYLLIDRACASSCESIVEVLERHPRFKTVGENTGGFVHFGNMGYAVLPRSGIVVQMATDFWRFDDGRYVEQVGYAPKLRVAPGGDALAAALADLEASGSVSH